MSQLELDTIEKSTKLDQFSKGELIEKYSNLEEEYYRAIREIYRLKYQDLTEAQLNLVLEEHLAEMKQDKYGSKSERWKKPANKPKEERPPSPRVKRPSERYPNVVIREIPVKMDVPPGCDACGKQMLESSMTEDSEQLYIVEPSRQFLAKLL